MAKIDSLPTKRLGFTDLELKELNNDLNRIKAQKRRQAIKHYLRHPLLAIKALFGFIRSLFVGDDDSDWQPFVGVYQAYPYKSSGNSNVRSIVKNRDPKVLESKKYQKAYSVSVLMADKNIIPNNKDSIDGQADELINWLNEELLKRWEDLIRNGKITSSNIQYNGVLPANKIVDLLAQEELNVLMKEKLSSSMQQKVNEAVEQILDKSKND